MLVVSPHELAVFLDGLGQPPPTKKLVRGYKVRVKRQAQTPEEMVKRREVVGKIIAPKPTD